MKRDILSTKVKTRIGFWNVRAMFERRRLTQITAVLRKYKLHILVVSESRWTGTRKIKTFTGETILYSGREDPTPKKSSPKTKWCQTVKAELKEMKHTWGTITKLAQNRNEWKFFFATLCANMCNRH